MSSFVVQLVPLSFCISWFKTQSINRDFSASDKQYRQFKKEGTHCSENKKPKKQTYIIKGAFFIYSEGKISTYSSETTNVLKNLVLHFTHIEIVCNVLRGCHRVFHLIDWFNSDEQNKMSAARYYAILLSNIEI